MSKKNIAVLEAKAQSVKYEAEIQRLKESISEWEYYHESLNQIFKGVKKALPDCKEIIGNGEAYSITLLLMNDAEVQLELENLLQKMIEEIENE